MTHTQSEGVQFTPSEITAMQRALSLATTALAFAFRDGSLDPNTQLTLARAILELATAGETDPLHLSAAALRRLAPMEAVDAHPARARARAILRLDLTREQAE